MRIAIKYPVIFFGLALIVAYCKDPMPEDTDPANLLVSILVYDDHSGKVEVTASAQNVVEYRFYMNEINQDYFSSDEGYYEYTYQTSGAYTIEVRAYGASGKYISEEKTVIVESGPPEVIGEGYATPFSYDGMTLVWNDEFIGTQLNEDDWSFEIGDGCDISPDLCGWGNNELQYYKEENCWVEGGLLHIEAREEEFGGRAYTSSRIHTQNKQGFKYGRIDIRAIMPEGQGLWPALWMLGTNITSVGWPKCGEIDIMEMIGGSGRENYVSGNAYWDDNGKANQPNGYTLDEGFLSDKFHVFSIIWDEVGIKWFVNDDFVP